jgi:hypothetical protein
MSSGPEALNQTIGTLVDCHRNFCPINMQSESVSSSAFMPLCNLLLDRPFFQLLSFFTINYQAVRLVLMSL